MADFHPQLAFDILQREYPVAPEDPLSCAEYDESDPYAGE